MNVKKALSVGLCALIYFLFILEMGILYNHPTSCSFSSDVSVLNLESYPDSKEEYIFQIDNCSIDKEDVFHLVDVSGWILRKYKDEYRSVSADIVLCSHHTAYRIRSYPVERTDIDFIPHDNSDSKESYIGFLARFPAERVVTENPKYNLGFLIKENGKSTIFLTDITIDFSE